MTSSNSNTSLFWTSIIVFSTFVVLMSAFWFHSNRQYLEIKKEMRCSFDKVAGKEYVGPFQIKTSKLNDSLITVAPNEIENINAYINSLTSEVKRESNRAESIIDKDIDRLNLYMSIGIGFMTLLGIFVPVLVNVTSGQDLRDKHKSLESKFEQYEQKIKSFDAEKKKIDELKGKMSGLVELSVQTQINDANGKLQNAVGRFYYLGPIILTEVIRSGKYDSFIEIIDDLKKSFLSCHEHEAHSISKDEIFRTTILDFIKFLETERIRFHVIFNKRADNDMFSDLVTRLDGLLKSEKKDEEKHYSHVLQTFDEIIEHINKIRNETGSAA